MKELHVRRKRPTDDPVKILLDHTTLADWGDAVLCLSWMVSTLLHRPTPIMLLEGLHGSGKTKAAWFKDPDGNILALVSE